MMRRAAVLAFSFTLLAACTSEPPEEYDRGIELANEGRWEEAIAELDVAIESDPHELAYLARGTAHGQIAFDLLLEELDATAAFEEFDLALVDLDRAIELEPALVEAWSERAAVHAQKIEFDLAHQDLMAALRLFERDGVEDNPSLRLGLAELIYQGDGELPEGTLTGSLCSELATIEDRTVVKDGEVQKVKMTIFSGDLSAEEKMECGLLLNSTYTVTPLWQRILD